MDAFEGDGVFWIPGDEERQVAGRFRFTPETGVSLDLIGALGDPFSGLVGSQDQVARIVGVAGKKVLTLDQCFRTSSGIEMPGIQRESWTAVRVLAGAHWGVDDEVAFDEVTVQFDQLPKWIGQSGISVDFERENTGPISRVTVALSPLGEETVGWRGGSLTLAFRWSQGGDRITEARVVQSVYFKLKYPTPLLLGDVLVDVNNLQDLVTLAVDAPAAVGPLTLSSPDLLAQGEPARREQIEYYAQQVGGRATELQPVHRMLFTFAALGGLTTVARWLTLASEVRPVLGGLLSIRYASHIYSENRYQNVVSAAETLHRLKFPNEVQPMDEFKAFRRSLIRSVPKEHREWLGRQLQFSNEPRLRDRLAALVDRAGDPFARVVGDPADWVSVVVEVRNRLTHEDASQRLERTPGDLLHLSESVYVLVLLCLLQACDVSSEVLDRAPDHRRLAWIGENVRPVVTRLHAQIVRLRERGNDEDDEDGEAESR